MVGQVKQNGNSGQSTTSFMKNSSGNFSDTPLARNNFSSKNSRVHLPSVQRPPMAAEIPMFVQQYDHESKAGRKKFVEAVSRELLCSRSRRLKPYRYSSSSDEDLSESFRSKML